MTSGEELDHMLLKLRARGVSYEALAAVADVVFGWRLTRAQIQRRLQNLGARKLARRGKAHA